MRDDSATEHADLGHAILTGECEWHLCSAAEEERFGARVHRGMVGALEQLARAAREAGFELALLSGFRSFERQLSIWNRKVAGELAVLDSSGHPLAIETLTPRELVLAILRWSALPGASRHHWGTDIDVYDAAATPVGYDVQLVPAEVEGGGMHAPMHEWLDARIATGTSYGFYRPYDRDRGGVAPERWHLSYAPLSRAYARLHSPAVLRHTLRSADMRLKDVVMSELDELYPRFVTNVSPVPTDVGT